MSSPAQLVRQMKRQLHEFEFVSRHRSDEAAFVRMRKLPFHVLAILLLRQSVKGCQLVLNEAVSKLPEVVSVSASAFSQARAKFRHTAFIELNEVCVLPAVYDGEHKLFKSMSVLAIDGSKIMLPNNPSIIGTFGSVTDRSPHAQGTHCEALISCMYDVLNHICVQAFMEPANANERSLAATHAAKMTSGDLVLFDQCYASAKLMEVVLNAGADFVIRCARSGLKQARRLFDEMNVWDICEEITVDQESFKVRFIKVVLDTGEVEVLMTSLLDEQSFSTDDFKDIYWMRWGIENFYGLLKTRLELENFTGLSAEAVKQDFFQLCLSPEWKLFSHTVQHKS